MNMDQQYYEMRLFKDSLERFSKLLATSMQDLQAQHDLIDPLWRDETRKTYDAYWNPLHDQMQVYLLRTGPFYQNFFESKLVALERYLHG